MSSIFLKKNLNNDFFDIGKRLKEVREALKLTLDRVHEVKNHYQLAFESNLRYSMFLI